MNDRIHLPRFNFVKNIEITLLEEFCRTREMAVVKVLEDLSSVPRTHIKESKSTRSGGVHL